MAELKILLGMGESGKTTFAKSIGGFVIPADILPIYGTEEEFNLSMDKVVEECEDKPNDDIFLDGYLSIINGKMHGKNFMYLKSKLKTHIIKPIIIFTDAETIVNRIQSRDSGINPDRVDKRFVINAYEKIYKNFNLSNAECYHAINGKFKNITEYAKMMKIIIGVDENKVIKIIEDLKKLPAESLNGTNYDKFYQTISLPYGYQIGGYAGYEIETWNQIKDLVNWKNKSVADIGCLNGYYCFKVGDMRANRIVGYDLFQQACDTAGEIAKVKCFTNMDFKKYEAGKDKLPERHDIILILNMLHHVPNTERFLNDAFSNSNEVIMEVQFEGFSSGVQEGYKRMQENIKGCDREKLLELSLKHNFELIYDEKSSRPYRNIMYFKKCPSPVIKEIKLRPSTEIAMKEFEDKKIVAVEVGTWKGENALSILQNLNIDKLYLIDPYCEFDDFKDGISTMDTSLKVSSFEDAEKISNILLKGSEDKIIRIKKSATDALEDIPNNIDFIYLDGNHAYKSVKEDIENYYPMLKDGGIICGHDYDIKPNHPGVKIAVDEFAQKNNLIVMAKVPDWRLMKKDE